MKRKTKRRLARANGLRTGAPTVRANSNWRLKVYEDQDLLADNGPYVTKRGALVDAKELARRRASARDQKVSTVRTPTGRDAAYKVVDRAGKPTGFVTLPAADRGADLRYNSRPRRSASAGRHNPFKEAWEPTGPYAGYVGESARALGGRFAQDETGRIRATFKDVESARKFLSRLCDYRATEITDIRTGHWPRGPFSYEIEADLPKTRTRANHHLAPGQRASGAVRVVKPLGMRGKADFYIVEGHGLRAEKAGARKNGARKNRGKLPSMYPGLPPSKELIALAKRYQGKLHGVSAYAPGYGFPVDFSGPRAHALASAFAQEVHRRELLNPDTGGAQKQANGTFRVWAHGLDR